MNFTVLQTPAGDNEAGGGAYLRRLVEGLRKAGHHVAVDHGTVLPAERLAVIDGLGLPRFAGQDVARAVGLIHHPSALAPDEDKPAIRAAERLLLPRLRRVMVTSAAVAKRLREDFGVAAERIAVVPPGVPDVPRAAGSGGPGCAILSIGALVPRKGHAVLIEALARLFDLDWRLTIVGDPARDPACSAALRAQAEAQAPGRVRFAGRLDDAALDDEWRQADVFALATAWEGYSAPVAEALRRGMPVGITSGGGAAELIAPESGVVCPPGDVVGLSKALRRLIFDIDLRRDMAQAAWEAGQALPGWPLQIERFVAAAG